MPAIKLTTPPKPAPLPRKAVSRLKTASVSTPMPTSLPTISKPSQRLEDYTWLIYGEKKIGKTSLVSHFPSAMFCMFEPGGKALAIRQTPTIDRWEQFLQYIALLEKDTQGVKTVVIDPGNIAYDRCLDFICESENITHPGKVQDWGASWKLISQEFQKAHLRLAKLNLGFIVLAHAKVVNMETRSGQTFTKVIPVMSGSTEEFYAGVIDIIGYYHYFGAERFLQIRGDDFAQAGCRCESNFLTKSGEPIVRIPMGRSSKQAYENIVRAFNNGQSEAFGDVRPERLASDARKRAAQKKR